MRQSPESKNSAQENEDASYITDDQNGAHDGNDDQSTSAESVADNDYKAEIAGLRDQLLRAVAESDNTRRRMQKQIDDASRYAFVDFAREVLSVADNFRRALDAVSAESRKNNTIASLMEGLEATERQLLASFERFGISRIDPLGEPFDPHAHRVMIEIEDKQHAPGTVAQVLQVGYKIHDRLLREALVAVAKAPVNQVPGDGVDKIV